MHLHYSESYSLAVHVLSTLQVPEGQHISLEHVAETLAHCVSTQQGWPSAMFVTAAVNEVNNNSTWCNAIQYLNLFEIVYTLARKLVPL
jgi:hypothetical protein